MRKSHLDKQLVFEKWALLNNMCYGDVGRVVVNGLAQGLWVGEEHSLWGYSLHYLVTWALDPESPVLMDNLEQSDAPG